MPQVLDQLRQGHIGVVKIGVSPARRRHSCLVARDWPWHRAVVNELCRMSRSKACITICSYPPMGLAVKTILKDTYRLSWSISQFSAPSDCWCLLKQAKSDTNEDIDIFADHWCFKHCFYTWCFTNASCQR